MPISTLRVDPDGQCIGVLSSSDFLTWAGDGNNRSVHFIAPWGDTQHATLGCEMLILIALIVLFFSRPGITDVERDVRMLRSEVGDLDGLCNPLLWVDNRRDPEGADRAHPEVCVEQEVGQQAQVAPVHHRPDPEWSLAKHGHPAPGPRLLGVPPAHHLTGPRWRRLGL
jgi:hypothetical protein